MTAPGLPFVAKAKKPKRVRSRRPHPVKEELQYLEPEPPLPAIPAIPHLRERRLLSFEEMPQADIVGKPKVTLGQRLLHGVEAIGRSGLFDPESESDIESFLGSAFGTFADVRGGERGRRYEEEDLAAKIIQQALQQQRQRRKDELADLLTEARIGAEEAGAELSRARAQELLRPEEEEPDVSALVEQLRELGRDAEADLIKANPALLEDAPGTVLGLMEEEEPELSEQEKEAARRYDAANAFAAQRIAAEERDVAGQYEPAERTRRLGYLRRLRDPSFEADSALVAGIRPTTLEAETPAATRWAGVRTLGDLFARGQELREQTPDEILGLAPSDTLEVALKDFRERRSRAAAERPRGTAGEPQREADAPKPNESAEAYIRRLKREGKTPDEIRTLVRQHGLLS